MIGGLWIGRGFASRRQEFIDGDFLWVFDYTNRHLLAGDMPV